MKKTISIFLILISFISCNKLIENKKSKEQKELKLYIENLKHKDSKLNMPSDSCLFLEINTVITAKTINIKGDYITPIKHIDFPQYSFRNSTRTLTNWDENFKPEIEKVEVILGKSTSYGENFGSGAYSKLSTVNYFPFYENETAIYEIDNLRSAIIRHENIYYKLKIGTTKDSTLYIEKLYNCERVVKIELYLTNHGLINKKNIKL